MKLGVPLIHTPQGRAAGRTPLGCVRQGAGVCVFLVLPQSQTLEALRRSRLVLHSPFGSWTALLGPEEAAVPSREGWKVNVAF